MGRLIDADVLIEELNRTAYDVQNAEELYNHVLDMVKNSPTAYDPKQVMEEIKEYDRKVYGEIVTVKILQIVRRGGIK